jgi:hypothetical protein
MAGGVPITTPSAQDMMLNILLWGDSGVGKTTLASTAPGQKLLVLLDPGGDLSLADRDDVSVLNLSGEAPTRLVSQFRAADPYGLGKILAAMPHVETLIIDSMTSLAYAALQNAVSVNPRSTIEQPGIHGYGYRNATVLAVTVAIMRMCQQHKRHLILVTHEDSSDRNDQGVVQSVTMSLSAGVANQVGLRFNEIWWMSDTGTERRIAVRPCRLRKPMKTRMFHSDKPEFTWNYNPDTHVGDGIADWYHAWQEGNGRKLALPVRAASTLSKGVEKKGPR